MSHFCAFCQVEHSSMSCYHPGQQRLAAVIAQRDQAVADWERCGRELESYAQQCSALQSRLDQCHKALRAILLHVDDSKRSANINKQFSDIGIACERALYDTVVERQTPIKFCTKGDMSCTLPKGHEGDCWRSGEAP